MSDLWNLWDVKPPPLCSVKTELNFQGITYLQEITSDALKTIRELKHLHKEAAILSRFLYKHKRTFRHDKGMQNLVKVNQCLKRYLKLDMTDLLFNFKETLYRGLKEKATIAYLPTKQMLKFILLRFQAFSQLFVRITELTKTAGAYIYKKLNLGWALNLTLMSFCITARILATSKFLVGKSIEWYSSFYKCLPYLKETADFLPNYEFPTDLKVWLGDVDLVPLKKKAFIDDVFELIDLARDDDDKAEEDEDEDNEVKIINEKLVKALVHVINDSDVEIIEPEEEKEERRGIKRPLEVLIDEDFGVPINDEGEDEDIKEIIEVPKEPNHGKRKRKRKNRRQNYFKKLKAL